MIMFPRFGNVLPAVFTDAARHKELHDVWLPLDARKTAA